LVSVEVSRYSAGNHGVIGKLVAAKCALATSVV
jgi:hypothetical protein